LGIWEYFVFPNIQYAPKGPAIKQLLELTNLRAENVVFIDDNSNNLEEARFCCPGLMCLQDPGELAAEIDSPSLQGNHDPGLERLKQYRLLEVRAAARSSTSQSNVEFLRQSKIEVEISYDVESHMDRVVDLINRSNQLNFTKLRLSVPEARQRFEDQ